MFDAIGVSSKKFGDPMFKARGFFLITAGMPPPGCEKGNWML
jgi:hypothetical protein